MNIESCEVFFTSSNRSAGARLLKEGKVSFSRPSDTEITAYIKPNYRVHLKTKNEVTLADCTCSSSQKGQLCKHMWAAVLAVFNKHDDFFADSHEFAKEASQSNERAMVQEVYKLKQEIYRRKQYEKQKERAKAFKDKKKKNLIAPPVFPNSVQKALSYFDKNGFALIEDLNENSVLTARKKLARIFHPDRGGSHDESVELNMFSEILLKYVSKL
ncbi:MAG: SWIM zinc finger family protein [Pseudobdellovibrio sp.]